MINKTSLWVFLFLWIGRTCFAEVDFKNLKRAREFIGLKEECSYLSPEVPINLIRQGKLNNDYIYGDENKPTVQLIKTAFNSVSENPAFFQISPLASHIAKLLPDSVIGKLLKWFSEHEPKKWDQDIRKLFKGMANKSNPEKEEKAIEKQAESILKEIFAQNADFKNKIQESQAKEELAKKHQVKRLKEMSEELSLLKGELEKLKEKSRSKEESYCAQTSKDNLEHQTQEMQSVVNSILDQKCFSEKELEEKIKDLEKAQLKEKGNLEAQIQKHKYEPKKLGQFLKQVLKSFHSEADSEGPLRHSTEQILLSIAWMNGESKKDLLSVYQELPKEKCFTENSRVFSSDSNSGWLEEKFTEKDYADAVEKLLKLTPAKRAEYLLKNPDELAFLSYGRPFLDPSALPTMGFKQVEFTHPKTKQTVSMPDCMDYAILNKMLNDLAGGAGNSFHTSSLQKNLNELGYEMHPGLRTFLEKYTDPARVNEMEAHRLWAELVSGLPGVAYVQKDHEIDTTVSNALELYGQLLFYKSIKKIDQPYSTLTRSKKLDLVCQALSRQDRKIEWKLRGGNSKENLDATEEELKRGQKKDTDLVLEFTINGKPKYDWRIDSGHSQVDPRKEDSADWRKDVGPEMAKQILDSNRFQTQDRRTLAWFLNTSDTPKIFEQLKPKRGDRHYDEFLQSMPLESVDNKLFVIGELAETGRVAEIKKIHAKLPSDDQDTQRRYHATLADHQYPFGAKSKTLTGVEYELVPNHPVLGRSWKDPRGVTWGDTVPDSQQGGDKRLNWEDAKKQCLDKNPPGKIRESVEAVLGAIESNQELKQLRSNFLSQQTEEAKETLLKKYVEIKKDPIPGCYLPPIEEYLLLGVDLGRKEKNNQYLPQFLSHLYGRDSRGNYRWFWSSSGNPDNANYALYFDGLHGYVDGYFRNVDQSVRCVCGALAIIQ